MVATKMLLAVIAFEWKGALYSSAYITFSYVFFPLFGHIIIWNSCSD
jgi:hypothetical protein